MRCNHCMKEIKTNAKFCPYCGGNSAESNPPHQLAAGTVLNGKYLIGSSIGEGGFGITYVGFDLNLQLKIAVKEFFPTGCANRINTISNNVSINYKSENAQFQNAKDNFLREARSIAQFPRENGIVNVRDFFTENKTAYIVMDYLDGTNLSRYVYEHGVFSANKTISLMLPIISALGKMHSKNIIHRDISPDNIIYLTDGTLVLTDFGAARHFSNDGTKTMSVILKPGYAPYEQYSRKSAQGPWTDVYGLCATIYKCITGETPDNALDRCRTDELKRPSQLGVKIIPELENVIMRGLAVFPDQRYRNTDELLDAITKALTAEKQRTNKNIPNKTADEELKTISAEAPYIKKPGHAANALPKPVKPANAQANKPVRNVKPNPAFRDNFDVQTPDLKSLNNTPQKTDDWFKSNEKRPIFTPTVIKTIVMIAIIWAIVVSLLIAANNVLAIIFFSIVAASAILLIIIIKKFFESGEGFIVTFINYDGTVIETQWVSAGNSADPPQSIKRPKDMHHDYEFVGWSKDYTNITQDVKTTAQFKMIK